MLTLAKKLKVPVLDDVQMLLKILVPNLGQLDADMKKLALDWIVNHWEEVRANAALHDLLSTTRFVQAGETKMESLNLKCLSSAIKLTNGLAIAF